MYGDTSVIRNRASQLTVLAQDTRDRADVLRSSMEGLWVSSAATTFIEALTKRAADFDSAAEKLDEAAAALNEHAQSVDDVKQAIVEAEQWVGERWSDARHLISHVVESVEDGVAGIFDFLGVRVAGFVVHRARDILITIPSLPLPGSIEWLDALAVMRRLGA